MGKGTKCFTEQIFSDHIKKNLVVDSDETNGQKKRKNYDNRSEEYIIYIKKDMTTYLK